MLDHISTPPIPDVASPGYFADPFPAIKWMHEHAPVYWYDPRPNYHTPMWIISRLEDARFIESRDDLFMVGQGVNLAHAAFNPPDDPRFVEAMTMPNLMDAPLHIRHRNLVNHNFRPRRLAQLEGKVRDVVRQCFHEAPVGRAVDFSEVIANRVPIMLICDLMGLDTKNIPQFLHWSHAVFDMFEPGRVVDTPMLLNMFDFFEQVIDSRIKSPGDDWISALVTADNKGEKFSRNEMIMWCWVFLVAGQDTTANLLSGGMRALLDFPAQKQKLIEDPSLVGNAVEEMLRWVTPTWSMMRTAITDTEVGGQPIKAGEKVYMFYLANNRDPSVTPDPYEFRVDRKNIEHMAFGFGRHFCLGNPLARLEGRVVFEELVAIYPNVAQAGPWVPKLSTTSNYPGEVPVVFR